MALRVARGLFRVWLVLSVLWIGGVGVMTWGTFPAEDPRRAALPSICDIPPNQRSKEWSEFDCSWFYRLKEHFDPNQRAVLQTAVFLVLIPPAFVLALGSALVWAFKGFR